MMSEHSHIIQYYKQMYLNKSYVGSYYNCDEKVSIFAQLNAN